MRVLVACEFSGIVRDAFIRNGHEAISCDLLPTESPGPHYQGDVFDIIDDEWDLMIAHPPCTDLCISGARWFKEKIADGRQQQGIDFFLRISEAGIKKKVIENPVGIMSKKFRKPDQILQPWMFGHPETKATCLWLEKVNKLIPTGVVEGREPRIHRLPPTRDRGKLRSITYKGIAEAMADQWGGILI